MMSTRRASDAPGLSMARKLPHACYTSDAHRGRQIVSGRWDSYVTKPIRREKLAFDNAGGPPGPDRQQQWPAQAHRAHGRRAGQPAWQRDHDRRRRGRDRDREVGPRAALRSRARRDPAVIRRRRPCRQDAAGRRPTDRACVQRHDPDATHGSTDRAEGRPAEGLRRSRARERHRVLDRARRYRQDLPGDGPGRARASRQAGAPHHPHATCRRGR